MAGKGFAGLAVDEEANLLDAGKVLVERPDDREQGQRFDLDSGRMVFGEGAREVDDCGLSHGAYLGCAGLSGRRSGRKEDFFDSWTRGERMLRFRRGVIGEKLTQQDAGAGASLPREGKLAVDGRDGAVDVAGLEQRNGFFRGGGLQSGGPGNIGAGI